MIRVATGAVSTGMGPLLLSPTSLRRATPAATGPKVTPGRSPGFGRGTGALSHDELGRQDVVPDPHLRARPRLLDRRGQRGSGETALGGDVLANRRQRRSAPLGDRAVVEPDDGEIL